MLHLKRFAFVYITNIYRFKDDYFFLQILISNMEMIKYFGLAYIYGVPLWRFPFILLPFAFCIYTGYCLFLKLYVVQYQRKEVINGKYILF